MAINVINDDARKVTTAGTTTTTGGVEMSKSVKNRVSVVGSSTTLMLYALAVSVLCALFAANSVYAIDQSKVPKKKQTTAGLYFTAEEAHSHMQKHGAKTLFIDVRGPTEVNAVGMPVDADANVPFKTVDVKGWNPKKKQFSMKANPDFVKEVEKRLTAKGLTKNDTVIVMCRSGPRSAKAADVLVKAGFAKVYNLIDGFEGDKVKEGPKMGQRTINGWKNAGLPWNPPQTLDIAKMYGDPMSEKPKK